MRDDTKLTRLGVHPDVYHGALNPPVMRGSTMVFPNLRSLDADARRERGEDIVDGSSNFHRYGIYGTDTAVALREAMLGLEGGYGVELVPSGLAAISTVLLSFLERGDHLLVTDNVYGATRHFCDSALVKFGIEVEYFSPSIGSDIRDLFRDNTRLVWLESPGSLTFEIHDTPSIVEVCKHRGIVTVMDNTWGAGYYYRPLSFGVDISIQAGTKYIGGHSDIMLGIIISGDREIYDRVHCGYRFLGMCVSPDDIYLALRGFRSMGVRLARHYASGLRVAEYLGGVSEVVRVMHPGLVGDLYHDLWLRDFSGACGLFGFVMVGCDRLALGAMFDGLSYFDMGYSWGGFGSLIMPTDLGLLPRSWDYGGDYQGVRLHIGLDDVEDLIGDLESGFERLRNFGA